MAKIYRFSGFTFIFLLAAIVLSAQPCDCVSTGNCPVLITDNGTFYGTLDVAVNGPNDLGQCPLTSLCFSITHTWVGDLSVALTSPNGTNYLVMADANNNYGGCGTSSDNIDVCIVTGTFKPLTNNTEYLCNAGPCQSGTCCLTGDWTVPCGGVSDPVSGATQAPSCNLNDFNQPGAPANGTWTLTVNDICGQDIGYLNNFSLEFACGIISCTVCNADGGAINHPNVATCFGSPLLNLTLIPQYIGVPQPNPAEYGYAYVISQNGIVISINPTSNMTTMPQGNYQVCGISYLLQAQAQLQSLIGLDLQTVENLFNSTTVPFCADLSNGCVNVLIGPTIMPQAVYPEVCAGECVYVGGMEFCQSGSVTLQSWLGCDSTINVVIVPLPLSFSTVTDTVCQGECVTVNNQLYCPPGPHVYALENWRGCDSIITLNLYEVITAAIINPPVPPPLSCSTTSITLNGSSSVPSNATYSWTGPGGFTSTQPSISVISPGNYMLTVSNHEKTPPCTSQALVTVTGNMEGPELIVAGAPPEICIGESFDLASLTIVDANNTNPVISFHTGLPATAANELQNTVVAPTATTSYYVKGTSGTCSDIEEIVVTVRDIPTADFVLDSPICKDSSTIVTYVGSADPSATFNWNFGGGTATPGTGSGPHSVEWISGGIKTVTLTVTEGGCTSLPQSQTVEVEEQIPAPVINCFPATTSIAFVWEQVPGAVGYNVSVIVGPDGVMVNDTTYEISGLNPGQQTSISVEAISGNSCGNTSTQITCIAQDCPIVNISIDSVASICLDGTAQPIQLVATQTGGDGSGSFTFQGAGVNPISGVFNPVTAGPGAHTIVVSYEEGTCLYNASRVIHVYPQPSSDFSATSPVCQDDNATVNYTGGASGTTTFFWDFGGGTATPGAGAGPHSVEWPTGGNYTISLFVEENGCVSDTSTQIVETVNPLQPPTITCISTTETIEFFWNSVPGSSGFNVNVISGGTGTSTSDTSMLFTGLSPGDNVTIEVTALSSSPCPNASANQTCSAQDCPNIVISIDPVADICLDANATVFDVQATISGGDGTGTLTWSGDGITQSTAGTFDPQLAGIGAHTIKATFEENSCTFSQDIVVNIYAQPQAGFSADTPVCEEEESEITYTGVVEPGMTWDWEFGTATATPGTGQGPHQLTWASSGAQPVSVTVTSAQNCISEPFTDTIFVETPLVAPDINCVTTTTSIEFSWPDVTNATSYVAVVIAGPAGSQTSQNTYFIDGLIPNDEATLELTISNGGSCPPVVTTKTCVAKDCPPIVIAIDSVAPLCIGSAASVQLATTIAGSGGTGVGAWSGPGVNSVSGVFNPGQAGVGKHIITYNYEEDNCFYSATTTITVFSEPTANFSIDNNICVTESATLTYQGNASSSADYTWDFDGGTAVPGTGSGPHTISWSAPGSYSVSLLVGQDGCNSIPVVHQVQVDPELVAPAISCATTTTSIQFTWPNVANATDYTAVVIAGTTGTQTSANSYFIDGLTSGDEITLQLTVSGNTVCPDVVTTQTCIAKDCPQIAIEIEPVAPVCLTPLTGAITLQANLTGNGTSGVGTWSGPGITNAAVGIFDPAEAGAGTHQIQFAYEEENCSFAASIQIIVGLAPIADAGENAVLTCKEDETEAVLGGNNTSTGSSIIYNWKADFGPFPGDSTILHPVVSMPGTYTLTVIDTFLNCESSDIVIVEASKETPVPSISVTPISCFGKNDGAITVTSVSGGLPPYLFSINDSPFSSNSTFTRLSGGIFHLVVLDAAGCENVVTIEIVEPQEVGVDIIVYLEGNNVIYLGDSVLMEALLTLPADSLDLIEWEPDSLLSCGDCLRPTAYPLETTTFTVRVEKNGCPDSDQATIFVKRSHPIYVPNAFSPNADGINDVFMIFAGSQVSRIKTFLVFSRWGEVVYQFEDFLPNDPTIGWDGTHRNQPMDPGVYTWFAEVEFIDGVTEIIEGDVILMR